MPIPKEVVALARVMPLDKFLEHAIYNKWLPTYCGVPVVSSQYLRIITGAPGNPGRLLGKNFDPKFPFDILRQTSLTPKVVKLPHYLTWDEFMNQPESVGMRSGGGYVFIPKEAYEDLKDTVAYGAWSQNLSWWYTRLEPYMRFYDRPASASPV